MEQLTASVYECTLPVEAHMICDLLSQAGISARVDGEFLAGAGGELPLGNSIRVRVDPSRVAEAREVIADWEKSQPAEKVAPAARPKIWDKSLWFFLGLMAGVAVSFMALSTHRRADSSGLDLNGDGRSDVVYHYQDSSLTMTEADRNFDGTYDERWTFDSSGAEKHYEGDDDFNGRFEWQTDFDDEVTSKSVLDADGDGRAEQVWHWKYRVLERVDYHYASGGRIVKRALYEKGLLAAAEHDGDGDGIFERRVEYDAHQEPKL